MYLDRNALGMLRKMGLKVEEMGAKRVVIEMEDRTIVFENPQVVKTKMQGQEAYQIIGTPTIKEEISEEDVQLVVEKTGVSKEEAERALREAKGDIAEAILRLAQ